MEAFALLRYWSTTAGPTTTADHRRIAFDLHFTPQTCHEIEQPELPFSDLKSATGFRLLLLHKSGKTQNQDNMLTLNFQGKPLLSLFPNSKHTNYTAAAKTCNNLQAWVNVMGKRLRKRRSTPPGSIRRREESLVVVEDGIQGAILHCKRSFHSNRGTD